MSEFDVIVIGAGPAGENVADYARRHGLSAAIIESELVGGECSYWGCMPSKALLRPSEVLAAARRVPAAASAVTGEVDVEAALRSRDAFTSGLDDAGQVDWLESAGVELFRGSGRLDGTRRVVVDHEDGTVTSLTARRGVVIAVGSRASIPPIDGLEDIDPWDNRDATQVRSIPARLLVLGGGVIGVEMAQALARLGSAVTIVEAQARLLSSEEAFASDIVEDVFASEGITLELGASATNAARDADGRVTLTLDDGHELHGDELLVAVGRGAPTEGLGLDTVGVNPGSGGFIDVDDHLRVVGNDWLYVVGDANGRAMLTHQGKYQARLVGEALAGAGAEVAWADHTALPRVVFTDPNVAAVGLTERQARDAGHDVETVDHDMAATAGGALLGRDVRGAARLVIDRDAQRIVGATFVGPGAAEMLHAATVAIVAEVDLDRLWHAVPAFPTGSEVWLRLLETLRDRARG